MHALLPLLCLLAAAPQTTKVAVLELTSQGATPELAAAVHGIAVNELQRLGVFQLTTPESVRAVLSLERERAMLGSSGDASPLLNELSSTLGVDYALRGTISQVDKTFTLELVLDDTKTARPVGSDVEHAGSASELLGQVGKAVSKTFHALLQQRTGRLLLEVSEPGAVVRLDDEALGSAPLPGALAVPGGPHELSVDKAGFITVHKQVRIEPNEVTEERVTLVPSDDYIAEHQGKAKRMRVGAWAASGLAVASLGAAALFQLNADHVYGGVGQAGTFLDTRSKLAAGDETQRTTATALQGQVTFNQTLSYVGAGVGLASAAAAAYLWIAGEDPNRYARFKASVVPTRGGAAAGLLWSF